MAGHFPSFVQEMRGAELQKGTYTLDSWGANATARTKTFIPNAPFASYQAQILRHVDPAQTPANPVLPISGLAGIGKTRCVYESLRSLKAANGLVLYIDNEQEAAGVATLLATTPRAAAILVVDDCSTSTRFRLHQALVGHRDRVRVLTIEHDAPMERQPLAELAMEKYGESDIEKIMQANYKGLAPERLRAYVHLSAGYLRLAIDLCEHDSAIVQAQGLAPADWSIRIYYEQRTGAQRDYVSALALFTRVGREGDVTGELEAVCKWRGFKRAEVEQRFAELKDSPGFVTRSAIYYRVSPELIAMQAFDDGWRKWASGREDRFLGEIQELPEELQKSFLNRVSRSANKEVREIVRNFFRSFAGRFDGRSLGDLGEIFRLRALIEVDPDFYLPYLRAAVDTASDEQLRGPRSHYLGWEPRRQLVYIADQLAQFRPYFTDAESMLFRLANVENEPNIGNNATQTWQRLFRPQLSGTPLPFSERIQLLESRLPPAGEPITSVLRGALEKLYDFHGTRLLGSALIAGKIPEPEWRFRTREEVLDYVRSTLALLLKISTDRSDGPNADIVNALLLSAVETFVRQGFLTEVKESIPVDTIPATIRAELHARFTLFLGRAEKFGLPPALAKNNYSEDLVSWLNGFQPENLLGRLIIHVSNSSWDHFGKETEWRTALTKLAEEACDERRDNPIAFRKVLDWLHSEKARGAFDFGLEMGKLDTTRQLFREALEVALKTKRPDFVRGLVAGYVATADSNVAPLNEELNDLQRTNPEMAFYIAQAMGDAANVFERTLAMVKTEQISPLFLRNFTVWVGSRRITIAEVEAAVAVLLPFVQNDTPGTAETMIEFIAYQYHADSRSEPFPLERSFDELAFRVLSETIRESSGQAFWWGEIATRILPNVSPVQAADLLVRGLKGDNFHIREIADELLGKLAIQHPDEVMTILGGVILDDEDSWRFSIARTDWLLSLPVDVISRWLDEVGARGALAVARHVPPPFISDIGVATLHPLTELLLSRFGDDERVFNEFAAGVHSLQTYMGDIAGQKEKEARDAEKFLHYPIPAVRRWAEIEIEAGKRDAEQFRAEEDKRRD